MKTGNNTRQEWWQEWVDSFAHYKHDVTSTVSTYRFIDLSYELTVYSDVIELTATLDGVKPFQEDTAIHPKESPPLGIVNEENSDGDKADKIPIDSFYTRHDDEERPPKAQQPELVVHRSDAFDLGDLQTVLEEDIWSRLNSSKDLSHQRGTEDEPQAKQFTPNTCEEGLVSRYLYLKPITGTI